MFSFFAQKTKSLFYSLSLQRIIIQVRFCATKEDCKNNWRGWTLEEMTKVIDGFKKVFPTAMVRMEKMAFLLLFISYSSSFSFL
jgi:hypothetical protein